LITERNAAAAHLHIDETSWKVYAAVEGKDSHRVRHEVALHK